MAGAKLKLTIDAEAGFALDVTCTDKDGAVVNITGAVVVSEIRANYEDEEPLAVFSESVDGVAGVIHLTMSHTETAKLQGTETGVWDLFVSLPNGEPARILYGPVIINQAASRTV